MDLLDLELEDPEFKAFFEPERVKAAYMLLNLRGGDTQTET